MPRRESSAQIRCFNDSDGGPYWSTRGSLDSRAAAASADSFNGSRSGVGTPNANEMTFEPDAARSSSWSADGTAAAAHEASGQVADTSATDVASVTGGSPGKERITLDGSERGSS